MITIIVLFISSFCFNNFVNAAAPAPVELLKRADEKQRLEKKVQFAAQEEIVSPTQAAPSALKPLGNSSATHQTLSAISASRARKRVKTSALAQLYTAKSDEERAHDWNAIKAAMLPLRLKPSKQIKQEGAVTCALWHPNGSQLITFAGGKAGVVDLKTNQMTPFAATEKTKTKGHKFSPSHGRYKVLQIKTCEETIQCIALNSDGTRLAIKGNRDFVVSAQRWNDNYRGWWESPKDENDYDSIIHFWDTKTGIELEQSQVFHGLYRDDIIKPFWHPHNSATFALTFAHEVGVYDAQPELQYTMDHNSSYARSDDKIISAFWSNDGKKLITTSKKELNMWDPQESKRIWKEAKARNCSIDMMRGYNQPDTRKLFTSQHLYRRDEYAIAAYNEHDNLLATASGVNVHVWARNQWNQLLNKFSFTHLSTIDSVSWNPCKELISSSVTRGTNNDLVHFSMTLNSFIGDLMVVAGNTVCIWNTNTGERKFDLAHQSKVKSATYNRDGSQIVTVAGNNAYVWNAATGDMLYILPHQAGTNVANWAPDNVQLATGSNDTTVCVWDPSPYNALVAGKMTDEQAVLLKAEPCRRFRAQFPHYIPCSLKTLARHFHTPGVTTAELARVLSTLHPDVMEKFLSSHNISTERQTPNSDQTAQEDYLKSFEAFEVVQDVVPLGDRDDISNALRHYIVDADPRLDSADAHEDLVDLALLLENEQFKKDSTHGLFAAIAINDLGSFYKYLNPASVLGVAALNRTPLMHAICLANPEEQKENNMFQALLDYQELFIRIDRDPLKHDPSLSTISESNLAATDDEGNTPLMLAIEKGCFYFALKIAQKMDRNSLHHAFAVKRKGNQESAYNLAIKVREQNKDNLDYQAIMKILEKHKK